MKSKGPIGVFDSGVGGTSIWKEIRELLPSESTIYLADSKNAPYGVRTDKDILALCIKNTEKLLEMGCKLIVVACNTATTNAISTLRNTFDIPFIGIEPAIKPAALQSSSKNIGILATKGTLSSQLFHKTSQEHTQNVEVTEIIGEGLVSLIEEGKLNSPEMTLLLQQYIQLMINAKVDYIVLGCSHYPYLVPQIKKIIPDGITIIDSGEAVARQTQAILAQYNLEQKQNGECYHKFYSNGNPEILARLLDQNYFVEFLDF